MTGKIDISPAELAIVQGILRDHLPKGTLVWAFGSRVTWTAKPFSDLDIALEGAEPLPSDVLIDLEEAFEASDLPWKVDVIDLNAVSPEFRTIVARQRVPVDWMPSGRILVGTIRFGDTFAIPLRNGVYKPKAFHGRGAKIVNMGELFKYPRMRDVPMKRVELTDKEQERSSLEEGDLLFARRSLTAEGAGKCSIILEINEPTTFESSIIRARLNSAEHLAPFYYYYFCSPQGKAALGSILRQVAVSGITGTDLQELSVPFYSLKDQKTISGLLSTLDDKIELNRRMNETLEAMARAVFRDWFVDFGPTRRKAAGVTDPAAILGGLLPDPTQATPLAALFPDSFGDNGLPEGWEEKPLDEIAEFLNGLALQKFPAKVGNDSLPVVKIAELRGGVTAKSNRASRNLPQKYVINDGDFVFSWSGSLMAKFWTEGEGALNQHLFKVSSETYPAWFYSQWVYHHLDEFQRIAASKATTMGHIQRGHLKAAITVDPGEDMLNAMGDIMGPLLELAIHNAIENQSLAATRDLLLPKLISGEIRLTGAEGVV